ncbi:MAG: hypothetical protein AAB879_02335 [Patescibacteria group bacterium]
MDHERSMLGRQEHYLSPPEEWKKTKTGIGIRPAEVGIAKEKTVPIGVDLTKEYLVRTQLGDHGADEALTRLVRHLRSEYVRGARVVVKNIPDEIALASFIRSNLPKLLGVHSHEDAIEVYTDLQDAITDHIRWVTTHEKSGTKKPESSS